MDYLSLEIFYFYSYYCKCQVFNCCLFESRLHPLRQKSIADNVFFQRSVAPSGRSDRMARLDRQCVPGFSRAFPLNPLFLKITDRSFRQPLVFLIRYCSRSSQPTMQCHSYHPSPFHFIFPAVWHSLQTCNNLVVVVVGPSIARPPDPEASAGPQPKTQWRDSTGRVSTNFATTSFGCSCWIHLLKAPS